MIDRPSFMEMNRAGPLNLRSRRPAIDTQIHQDTPSIASMTPTTSVFSSGGFQSRRGDLLLSIRVASGSGSSVPGPSCTTGGGAASGDGAKVPPPPVKSALIKSGRFLWPPGPPLPRVRFRYQERSSDPYPSATNEKQKKGKIQFENLLNERCNQIIKLRSRMKSDRLVESRCFEQLALFFLFLFSMGP